jgi:hypothetical protein
VSTTESELGVLVTTRNIGGTEFPVYVNKEGEFALPINEELILTNTHLVALLYEAKDTIKSLRLEVPFLNLNGAEGVIRGLHASNSDLLVTWYDGEKDRVPSRTLGYRPGTVSQEELDELRQAKREMAAAQEKLKWIEGRLVERQVNLADLFNESIGEELLNPYYSTNALMRDREQAE